MALAHAANTVLVYLVGRRLPGESAAPAAWVAAALFAVHPIHTEAVNWIAALPDLLVTTFVLLGMLAWVTGGAVAGRWRAAWVCGCYLLALWTKETGVMLLPLCAAFDWLFRWGALRQRAWLYGGMAAVLGLYLAMRVHALGGLAPAQEAFFHLAPAEFAMSAAVAAAHYFASLAWPVDLNFFHVFRATTEFTPELALAAIALVAIGGAAYRLRRRPAAVYGILWIALTMAPALNLTGVGQNVFAERYLYLPSVGFVWVMGLGWAWLAARRMRWAWALAAVAGLACSAGVLLRNADWRDDFTLLQTTLRQSPDSAYLHNLMAGVWVQRDQFRRALDEQRLAVRYEPGAPVYHKNLGNILLGLDAAEAAREFQIMIAQQPGIAEGHLDLGLAYQALRDPVHAAEEYRKALALEPNSRDALLALAELDKAAGKMEEAAEFERRARQIGNP
jgi:tetratricopeptide (TPR) repeat protein